MSETAPKLPPWHDYGAKMPPAPKPATPAQTAARKRNWQRLQLKSAFWILSGFLSRPDQAILSELRRKAEVTIDKRWKDNLPEITGNEKP